MFLSDTATLYSKNIKLVNKNAKSRHRNVDNFSKIVKNGVNFEKNLLVRKIRAKQDYKK